MMNTLQKIDMYGVGLNLRYNHDEFYQTRFGGLITLIICLFILVQLVLSGADMINKKNPEIIFTERYVADPERFTMKNDTFNFAIGVQHPKTYAHYIDESIYTVSMKLQTMHKVFNQVKNEYEQDWKEQNIEMAPCKKANFQVEGSQSYFETLAQVDDMYCIADPSQEVFIEGNFDSAQYAFVRIQFQRCKDKPTCKKDEEIDAILSHAFVAMYSSNVIIDPRNLDPYAGVGKDAFWNISPTVAKDVEIYFRNIYMDSDEAYLFKDSKILRTTKQSFQLESVIFDEKNYFFSVLFRFEKQMETMYYRKFKKVDQLLAEVGGIAKALLIIGFLICFPINRLNLHENLANNLFIFKKTELVKEQKKQNGKEQLNDKNNNSNYNTNNITDNNKQNNKNDVALSFLKIITPKLSANKSLLTNLQQQQLLTKLEKDSFNTLQANGDRLQTQKQSDASEQNDELNTLRPPQKSRFKSVVQNIQQMQINEQDEFKLDGQENTTHQELRESDLFNENNVEGKLKLTWKQYIKYYIWPWGSIKNVRKQVDTSIKSIYNHVDVIKIIQLQLEFEKVKHLLLNEDQIKLLKFLPKPIIDISESENLQNQNILKRSNTKKIDLLNSQSELDTAKEAAIAFENIINKPDLTETDLKLIMMLDDKILNFMLKHRLKQFNSPSCNQIPTEQQEQCLLQQPTLDLMPKSNQDVLQIQQSQREMKIKQSTINIIMYDEIESLTNPTQPTNPTYPTYPTNPCDVNDTQYIKSHEIYQSNSPKLKQQISAKAQSLNNRDKNKKKKVKSLLEGKNGIYTQDDNINTNSHNFYKINIPSHTSSDLNEYKIQIQQNQDNQSQEQKNDIP